MSDSVSRHSAATVFLAPGTRAAGCLAAPGAGRASRHLSSSLAVQVCAVNGGHEANVETLFSRAGYLTDPNMDPAFMATLVRVGFNENGFKPSLEAIKERYYEKYRGRAEEDAAPDAQLDVPGSSSAHVCTP